MKLPPIIRNARRWFFDTPERALDQAYRSALQIKAIEDEHFNGNKVSLESTDYGDSATNYFKGDVTKYLNNIKIRLSEFEASNSILRLSELNNQTKAKLDNQDYYTTVIIEKLNFIDQIIAKYQSSSPQSLALIPIVQSNNNSSQSLIKKSNQAKTMSMQNDNLGKRNNVDGISEKTGLLPRSILRTLSKIKQDIDPNSNGEEEVVTKFRKDRDKTAVAIKFLLTLVIVPLLAHQLTKIVVAPILDNPKFHQQTSALVTEKKVETNEEDPSKLEVKNIDRNIFFNHDFEEEALIELRHFEEKLELEQLVGIIPKLDAEAMEKLKAEKAEEIVAHFQDNSDNVLANWFADGASLIAFTIVLIVSQKEISMLKAFLDEIIYGLSDSAKAFLIILFTDIFVGYHSPHGWEIVLENIFKHLGLPESRNFNFLFIATFPVILDTVLKYWIFRYLNRISPSAVATYRNMNE